MKLEVLNFEPAFERINAPFIKNLQLLGIDATIAWWTPRNISGALRVSTSTSRRALQHAQHAWRRAPLLFRL